MATNTVPSLSHLDQELLSLHLDQINARLPGATPHGAYALGLLTVTYIESGACEVALPIVFYDVALTVPSVCEAVAHAVRAADYINLERRTRRNKAEMKMLQPKTGLGRNTVQVLEAVLAEQTEKATLRRLESDARLCGLIDRARRE